MPNSFPAEMLWSDALVHWLHLTAAILWVGGALFTSLVLQPALQGELDAETRRRLYRALGGRLTKVQWATWLTLGTTGAWKLWALRATPSVFLGPFGAILAVKLALVSLMAGLSLAHARLWGPALLSGQIEPAARAALARRAAFWGRVNGAVMAAIVFCAALLRFNPW